MVETTAKSPVCLCDLMDKVVGYSNYCSRYTTAISGLSQLQGEDSATQLMLQRRVYKIAYGINETLYNGLCTGSCACANSVSANEVHVYDFDLKESIAL